MFQKILNTHALREIYIKDSTNYQNENFQGRAED